MKSLFLSIVLLAGMNAYSQAYLFVASYDPQGSGCKSKMLYTIGYSEGQYRTTYDNFRAEKKPQTSEVFQIPKGKFTVIYAYKHRIKGFDCERTVYGAASGITKEEALEKMYSITKDDDIAFRHSPKPEFYWNASTGEKIPESGR
jgi:major membrane immunogen (membrane-anchored lipoprotein)